MTPSRVSVAVCALVAACALLAVGIPSAAALHVDNHALAPLPKTMPNGVNVERCHTLLLNEEGIPRSSFWAVSPHVPPRKLSHPHPAIDHGFEFYAVFDCIVDEHFEQHLNDTLDLHMCEKYVYGILEHVDAIPHRDDEATYYTAAEFSTDLVSHPTANRRSLSRRVLNTDTFLNGLLDAFREEASGQARGVLSGGIVGCIRGIGSSARDLYGYFRNRSPSLLSTIRTVARTVSNCLSVATKGTPVGWIRGIIRVARAVYNAATIFDRCGALVSALRSNNFNSFAVGRATGRCINTLVNVFGRRRREVAVHPQWTCDPEHYANNDGCDVECGAFDPDCYDIEQPVFYNASLHVEYAPEGWLCPASYYNGTDGCDMGCGLPDPDCTNAASASSVSFSYSDPTMLSSIAAERSYWKTAQTGEVASSSSDSGSHSFSTSTLAIILACTALVASLATIGVMTMIARRNTKRKTHTLLSNQGSDDTDMDSSYSLHPTTSTKA